jgi:hypothetical protein
MSSREAYHRNKPETKTVRVSVALRNEIRAFAAYRKCTMKEAVDYLLMKAIEKLNGE